MAALVKAFFWQEILDSGRVKNMTELAKVEKIGLARMHKMLKLGSAGPGHRRGYRAWLATRRAVVLFFVENPLPDDWNAQREVIGGLAG